MKSFDEATHPGWGDWMHLASLTIGEAACLLSRVHPMDYCGKGFNELPAKVKSKGLVLANAIQKGELLPKQLYVVRSGRLEPAAIGALLSGDQIAYDTTLACDHFAKWCDKHGYPHPWAPGDQSSNRTSEVKPLVTRERETLLSLIAVLAELAGIDLRPDTKGHAEAASIMGELQARKVNIDKRTVADKLTAARELIAPKGPGRVTDSSK